MTSRYENRPHNSTTPFPPLVEPGPELTRDERARFARHLILRGFGPEAQRRVRAASVLVIGAGGLGSPILLYLAAAGVGRITVIDDDVVDISNLHRQVIHGASGLGQPKAESAAGRLADLTDLVEIRPVVARIEPSNIFDQLADVDLVIDGSDNFFTRYLVADACEITGKPLVWGTLDRFRAQLSVFWADPPTGYAAVGLRDVYPAPPAPGTVPSCAEAGVLGALTGQVGSIMALQALWLITGAAEPILGRLVLIDSLTTSQRVLRVSADPARRRVTVLGGAECQTAGVACEVSRGPAHGAQASSIGTQQPQQDGVDVQEVTVLELSEELKRGEGAKVPVLLDVRESGERAVASIEPSLWVPLGELDEAVGDPTSPLARVLESGQSLVVYCKAGGRSAMAAEALERWREGHGQEGDVRSLAGGIDAWSEQVDPTLPRY